MSIYPVRLSEWFPKKPKIEFEWATKEQHKNWHETAKFVVEQSVCAACGKKPTFNEAWGVHSIPWGYGCDKIWCNEECLNGPTEG